MSLDLDYFVEPIYDIIQLLSKVVDLDYLKKYNVKKYVYYLLFLYSIFMCIKYIGILIKGQTIINKSFNVYLYIALSVAKVYLAYKMLQKLNFVEGFDFYQEGTPVVTGVVAPNPTIDILVLATPDRVLPGKKIRYNLQITNVGNVPARNLVVVDKVPDNTTYVSADNDGKYRGDFVSWDDIDLNPGEAISRSFEVYVDEDIDPAITEVTNNVYFAYNQV